MPSTVAMTRRPWNHGRLIGPKPPPKPWHISAIRTRLHDEGRTCNLAPFNTAIDSKLRGCDRVRLRSPPAGRHSVIGPPWKGRDRSADLRC